MRPPEQPPSTTETAAGTVAVGVDGSAADERALAYAVEQAVLGHRPLTLVHAVGSAFAAGAGARDHGLLLETVRRRGRAVLARARAEAVSLAPDLEVRDVLRLADVEQAMVEISRTAALVVLGTRGHGPVQSLVPGAVAGTVSRAATCPVAVIEPHLRAAARTGSVVGVDSTRWSPRVLEVAFDLADREAQELLVLFAFGVGVNGDVLDDGPDDGTERETEHGTEHGALGESRQLTRFLTTLRELGQEHPSVPYCHRVMRGSLDVGLVEAARGRRSVVVGSRSDRYLKRLLGRGMDPEALLDPPAALVVVPER